MMYWRWSGTGRVRPADTEATSYALLASLQLDDLRSSNETVNWLKRHRTSGGAFQSTQVILFIYLFLNSVLRPF